MLLLCISGAWISFLGEWKKWPFNRVKSLFNPLPSRTSTTGDFWPTEHGKGDRMPIQFLNWFKLYGRDNAGVPLCSTRIFQVRSSDPQLHSQHSRS